MCPGRRDYFYLAKEIGEGLIEEVTLKLDLNIKDREYSKYKI